MKSTNARALGWTLALGALADGGFGIPLLFLPRPLISLLGLPTVENEVYIRLVGLLLIVVGLFYLVTSFHPERYLANVGVAIVGRIIGPIFYLTYILVFNGERIFWGLLFLNLAFAIAHALALGPSGWSRFRSAFAEEGAGRSLTHPTHDAGPR